MIDHERIKFLAGCFGDSERIREYRKLLELAYEEYRRQELAGLRDGAKREPLTEVPEHVLNAFSSETGFLWRKEILNALNAYIAGEQPAETPAPRPTDPEFAWVIEHADSEGSRPRYFDGVGWSDPGDHAAAIRYSRKADAERMNTLIDPPNLHRVREHGWPSPMQPTAEQAGEIDPMRFQAALAFALMRMHHGTYDSHEKTT